MQPYPGKCRFKYHFNFRHVSKTEIQYLSRGSNNFQIYINGQELQQTDNFVYLGGNVGTYDGVDGDINRELGWLELYSKC